MSDLPPRVLFGAAYYHEYQPYERLKTDLDLMAAAGFTVIRVGESVWSTWEPEDGQFDLDWLQPVLDGAHERGISVVLGTPTYSVPPWLARRYPEIAGELRTGERMGWGGRQEADYTHAAFLFHAERVTRAVVARYADHPAVIGFQVDNEPGLWLFRNHGVFQRFVDDLRRTYGSVEALNREWGLVFWSNRLTTWADLWRPEGNTHPQYSLAWRRFQARLTTEFIAWQAGIVREYASPGQFVTTCIDYGRPAVEDDELAARLDVTAGNAYYEPQDALTLPDPRTPPPDRVGNGAWTIHQHADRMWSSRQEPFLVTETNANHRIAPHSRAAYDGQWRQAAWALVSRGAQMIEYWHWHTIHAGAETSWGGIIPHSGRPGRAYREIARIGQELGTAGDLVAGLIPDADVTLLHSLPTRWLMQEHPPLARQDGSGDTDSYHAFFDAFHRGAFDARLQTRIVHVSQLVAQPVEQAVEGHPVLVVPGLYVAEDATLDWLKAYAHAGGHLVVGPRTGYSDGETRARVDVQPGRLADAAGAWYEESANLLDEVPVTARDAGLTLLGRPAATRWLDALIAEDATVLAGYDHPHFGQWAAVTTRVAGRGRVTCVGALPNVDLARGIMRWLLVERSDQWYAVPDSVTSTGATARTGQRLRFLHNWSFTPVDVRVPVAVTDVLDATSYAAGDELPLGAWDVRVLVEN
ncbi:beta-galactosidase [Micromonospora sp. S-DT3-3-22]|uniref:beta-galactosidase n=1 Tax=Micromonospora sp. S-DT3-3-22 TaxID=2755359 RepID=UPI00188F2EC8|nr:beta-galactosidase [Micromonospora sp. S-DT3-3-22]